MNDNANSETVRKQLESCTEVRISMGIDAYETVQKMEAVLNDSQKKELQQQMTGTMQNYMHRYMQGYGMGAGLMNN